MSLSDNLQETFGLIPIEAMAAGLPVLVSDWDGYRDTVREGIDGFRIPTTMPGPGAGEDLALGYATGTINYATYCGLTSQMIAIDLRRCVEALVLLANDAGLRRRMGEAARRRARELFDWRVVIARYQELCEALALVRANADTTAPRRSGRPAFALRGDPFEVFAGYPSRALDEGLRLAVPQAAAAERIGALHAHTLTRFAAGWRASEQDMRALVRVVAERPGVTVGELCRGLEGRRRRVLVRTLAWLMKMGVLVAVDPFSLETHCADAS